MVAKRKSRRGKRVEITPRFETGAAPPNDRGPDGYEFLVWDNDAGRKGGWIAACPSSATMEHVVRSLNIVHHGRGDLPLVEHVVAK